MIPVDDSLLAGPEIRLRNSKELVTDVVKGGANSMMACRGFIEHYSAEMRGLGVIMNLPASTTESTHTRKVLVSKVEDAVSLDADCVAVHVNISSAYEHEMLEILGNVSSDCNRFGMPLLAIMYARGEKNGRDNNYEDLKQSDPDKYAQMVRHAARVGVEMGADIIKTNYTGSPESFKTVVEACCSVPVIIAGGPLVPLRDMLRNAECAISAGAAGVSYGRNVFCRASSLQCVIALNKIVHSGATANEAMAQSGLDRITES